LPSGNKEYLLPAGRKEYLSPSRGIPIQQDFNNGSGSYFQKNNILDNGKDDRLNFLPQNNPYAQPSKNQDLVRALIKANERRMTYGGQR